jgi:3-(3-hydroxy-phenyl)propionate hydroxylase
MEKFRHGRVLFAGDAAHGVSPFGARGANSGVQDAENLAWKLALVLDGRAPDALLDTYASEREPAADENILNSTRSTDFITPKSAVSRTFRDAVLTLSKDCAFARQLVNSGRLSVPTVLANSPLNTPDEDDFAAGLLPGSPSSDAPVRIDGREDWFLRQVAGGFTGIYFSDGNPLSPARLKALSDVGTQSLAVHVMLVEPAAVKPAASDGVRMIEDSEGLLARRFDAAPGTFYLLRPDQHVCARWKRFEPEQVKTAVARATGNL